IKQSELENIGKNIRTFTTVHHVISFVPILLVCLPSSSSWTTSESTSKTVPDASYRRRRVHCVLYPLGRPSTTDYRSGEKILSQKVEIISSTYGFASRSCQDQQLYLKRPLIPDGCRCPGLSPVFVDALAAERQRKRLVVQGLGSIRRGS
ncbi:hypothetical protein ARMSODRAFT_619586, partial [Armillaria solidipes]